MFAGDDFIPESFKSSSCSGASGDPGRLKVEQIRKEALSYRFRAFVVGIPLS